MKISYAVTVCNEFAEVKRLISLLQDIKRDEDEIVVLFDKGNGTAEVWNYLQLQKDCICEAKTFKNHFAEWKNYLKEMCSGDYIFQLDADEVPHRVLIDLLPNLLENNPHNEVYLVPRVNTVKNMKEEHIAKWGWRVDNKGWINWPDYQWRIWKNKKEIYWGNKVHEKLYGHSTYAPLPKSEMYAIYHPKTIEKQIKQNEFYDTLI